MSDTTNTPIAIAVAVKSAWASKVNWISAIAALLASTNELLNQVAPLLPQPYSHDATIAIVVIGAVMTIITKTFYTTTITPSSAAKV